MYLITLFTIRGFPKSLYICSSFLDVLYRVRGDDLLGLNFALLEWHFGQLMELLKCLGDKVLTQFTRTCLSKATSVTKTFNTFTLQETRFTTKQAILPSFSASSWEKESWHDGWNLKRSSRRPCKSQTSGFIVILTYLSLSILRLLVRSNPLGFNSGSMTAFLYNTHIKGIVEQTNHWTKRTYDRMITSGLLP